MSAGARLWGALALSIGVSSQAACTRRPPDPPIRAEPLTRHLTLIVGPGGNSLALSGPDGLLLIDNQFSGPSEALIRSLPSLRDTPARFVIRTQWSRLAADDPPARSWRDTGTLLIAHEDVRDRLRRDAEAGRAGLAGPAAAAPAGAPTIDGAFSDVLALELDGEDLHLVHLGAGHARGDLMAHFHGANVLYTGALFTSDGYPEIDVAGGGSADALLAAVVRLLGAVVPQTRIVPGRGPLANVEELRAYHAMLQSVVGRVRNGIARGQTAAQVIAARPSAEFDVRWGKGAVSPDAFVRAVYQGLVRGSR